MMLTDELPIEKTEGCWLWRGYVMPNGYGSLYRDGHTQLAHRYVYERTRGPIPDGLTIDHLCRVRACVNPAHLEPVTARVNLLRGETVTARNAAATHCPRGHAYSTANTVIENGSRVCRTCKRGASRRDYAKHGDARRAYARWRYRAAKRVA